MAEDKKISELQENPLIDGSENVVIEKGGSNFKESFTNLKDWILTFVTTVFIQTKRPIKTVNGESLEGSGDVQSLLSKNLTEPTTVTGNDNPLSFASMGQVEFESSFNNGGYSFTLSDGAVNLYTEDALGAYVDFNQGFNNVSWDAEKSDSSRISRFQIDDDTFLQQQFGGGLIRTKLGANGIEFYNTLDNKGIKYEESASYSATVWGTDNDYIPSIQQIKDNVVEQSTTATASVKGALYFKDDSASSTLTISTSPIV